MGVTHSLQALRPERARPSSFKLHSSLGQDSGAVESIMQVLALPSEPTASASSEESLGNGQPVFDE